MDKNRLDRSCAIALLLIASAAHGGRPLATEDAGVLERGGCEVESFAGHARAAGEPATRTLSLQFGCGVGFDTQLALAAVRTRSAGDTHRAGVFVGKTKLADLGASAFTVGYSIQRDAAQALAVLSHPFDDVWTLHANAGAVRDRLARETSTLWSLAIERAGAKGIDWMAETFGTDRDTDPWLQLGVRWAVVPETVYLDASAGRQTGPSKARAVTVGLKIAF